MKGKRLKKTANSFMKNVVILIFSQLLIKLLGLIYKLVITNIEGFGDTGLGYYSAGYQIYALLLTLSSIGIPSVISKLVSERIAIGDTKGAQRIFKIAFKFFIFPTKVHKENQFANNHKSYNTNFFSSHDYQSKKPSRMAVKPNTPYKKALARAGNTRQIFARQHAVARCNHPRVTTNGEKRLSLYL